MATPDDTMIFAINSNLFSRLLKRLLVVCKRVQDSILLAGMAILKTPVWGCDGDIGKFHCSNDFEILGVCFRAEVEDFLWKIHEGSEFSKGSTFDTSSNDVNPGHRMAEREFAAAGPSRIEVLQSQGLGRDGAFSVRDQPAASSASDGYSQIRQKQAASIYGGQDRKGKGLVRPSAPEIPKHTPVLSAIFEQVGNKFFKVHREERRDKSDNQQDQSNSRARERPPHLSLQGEREHPGQGSDYQSEASRFSSASRRPTNRRHR